MRANHTDSADAVLNAADFEDVALTSASSTIATPLLHSTVSYAAIEQKSHLKVLAPVHIQISPSKEDSESEHRACRICQSETGDLVRPCGCSGTMADIHENCLNEWLQRARNRESCEICQQEYAKSANVLPAVWKWTKPNVEFKNILELFMVAGLGFSLGYMIFVSEERAYSRRIFLLHYQARPIDITRLLLIFLIFVTFAVGLLNSVTRICKYVAKQRRISFIDAPSQ